MSKHLHRPLTRRRFVPAAATAMAAFGAPAGAAAAPSTANMKIGLYGITYGGVWYRAEAIGPWQPEDP